MTPVARPLRPRTTRQSWLIILVDLMALLLAFFVMLFATNDVEVGRWAEMTKSLARSLKSTHTSRIDEPIAQRNLSRLSRRRAIDLTYLEALLRDLASAQPALKQVVMYRRDDRLIIALPSDALFAPGSAEPVPSSRPILQTLGEVLQRIGNAVDIHGHTDPIPAKRGIFASNWGLSVARAVSVANELRRAGYVRPLTTLGFADTKFEKLPASLPRRDRFAMARRVDIVVRPTKQEAR